ncbi:hypothetical protein OQA88_13710 [Cercophora sp. LCS_1]
MYMAPEVLRRGRPTPELDVYSLFMTVLWVEDIEDFRKLELTLEDLDEIFNLVFASLKYSSIARLKEMAEPDPDRRASRRLKHTLQPRSILNSTGDDFLTDECDGHTGTTLTETTLMAGTAPTSTVSTRHVQVASANGTTWDLKQMGS